MPTITWTKNDQKQSITQKTRAELKIKSFDVSDEGNYSCTAENDLGSKVVAVIRLCEYSYSCRGLRLNLRILRYLFQAVETQTTVTYCKIVPHIGPTLLRYIFQVVQTQTTTAYCRELSTLYPTFEISSSYSSDTNCRTVVYSYSQQCMLGTRVKGSRPYL